MKNLSKEKLNAFVSSVPHSPFTQSYEWGQFQLQLRKKVLTMGIELQEKLAGSMILIEEVVGRFFQRIYSPYGPVVFLAEEKEVASLSIWEKTLGEMVRVGKELRAHMLRFEPHMLSLEPHDWKFPKDVPVIPVKSVQPPVTRIIDLTPPEEDLLKRMHQKTPYNIRLAEKKGVEVSCAVKIDEKEFREFYRLLKETAQRQKIKLHSKEYYQKMAQIFSVHDANTLGDKEKSYARLITAHYKGEVIAANMLMFFGDTVSYVHGGSSDEYKNVMAPYALQWATMKEAKRLGYKYYDMWGCMPETKNIDPLIYKQTKNWQGVDRFKKGFGGEVYYYPGGYELILNTGMYRIYKILKKLRSFVNV